MTDPVLASPPATPRVSFTEGSIQLPTGYEDRSTNMLVPANAQTEANLSVARDWTRPGESLAQYVDRQMSLLRSQLASHKLLDRRPVRLGLVRTAPTDPSTEANATLLGECIDATYRNGKHTVYNRQAAFEVAPMRVLIFSASKAGSFGAEFETLWTNWLASYQAPPPVADTANNTPAPDPNAPATPAPGA